MSIEIFVFEYEFQNRNFVQLKIFEDIKFASKLLIKFLHFICISSHDRNLMIKLVIVKFLQDKKKYRKRRAKISADISGRLFRVTCNKVSGILIHKD